MHLRAAPRDGRAVAVRQALVLRAAGRPGEELPDEFAAAVHTGLVENGLEVVLDSVPGDMQSFHDATGGDTTDDERGDLYLSVTESMRG